MLSGLCNMGIANLEENREVNKERFTNYIRQRRRELRLKQEDLAEKINVGQTYVSQIENGLSMPPADMIISLARALEVQSTFLFSLLDDEAFPSGPARYLVIPSTYSEEDYQFLVRIAQALPIARALEQGKDVQEIIDQIQLHLPESVDTGKDKTE